MVIAYIRHNYDSDAIPDWVGDIEDMNYNEILEAVGIDTSEAMAEATEDGSDG